MPVYTADFVLPVSSRLIRDGAVRVEKGRIAACGPRAELLAGLEDDVELRALGHAAVIPGLVNAHGHIELSWMGQAPPEGGDYTGWIRRFLELRESEDEAAAREAAEREIEAMGARGVVAVGDVANRTWVAPLLARSPLHAVVFHELLGFRAADAERLLREAVERLEAMEGDPDLAAAAGRVRPVLTPHAPHTVSTPLLRALGGRAVASGDPLSIHVAESADEVAMLEDGSGPLPGLLRERDVWDEGWTAPGQDPLEFIDRHGLLTPKTLVVHAVHLSQENHSRLQVRGATVVTCPRSNARLGVGQAAVGKLLGEGIPVALGTDSLASAPDLDLLAEMAALRELHGDVPPAAILRMATLTGAAALGLDGELGSIEPGKSARLFVVPLADGDERPFEAVCANPAKIFALEDAPLQAVAPEPDG